MIIGELFVKMGVDVSGLDDAEKLKGIMEKINSVANKASKSIVKFTV
jgi:hypothetical protein